MSRLAPWWFADVPARRVELVRRITFGYAAVWLALRLPYGWDVAALPTRRFAPVGTLHLLDAPPHRSISLAVWLLALVASGLVAAGVRPRVTTPLAALTVLHVGSFTSSFGQVFHTEHLLALHLLILAAAVLIEPDHGRPVISGWPLRLMMATVAAVYVVAGIAKLRLGGSDWMTGDVLRHHVAADNLRKLLLDDLYSPLGGWMATIAWLWPPIAILTIVVELGAPMALFAGRLRLGWVTLAWLFHVGVFALMAITFPYQLFGVAYVAFVPVERLVGRLGRHGRYSWPRPGSTVGRMGGGTRRTGDG